MHAQFTLIEQRLGNCQIQTSYVLDYHIYNYFQKGYASISIDFMSNGRVIKKRAVTVGVPMGFCGPYGHPEGAHVHVENILYDNLIDITDDIVYVPSRISGKIGQC